MKLPAWIRILIGVIALVVLAEIGIWWWKLKHPQPTATQTSSASSQASSSLAGTGGNVTLGENLSATLGTYLIANNGMTLYTYGDDSAGVSNCTGACAQTWPPYLAQAGTELVGEYPIGGIVGTTTRPDGTLQVTYNSLPLYFYSKDVNQGDTNGDGVGGAWYVAKP